MCVGTHNHHQHYRPQVDDEKEEGDHGQCEDTSDPPVLPSEGNADRGALLIELLFSYMNVKIKIHPFNHQHSEIMIFYTVYLNIFQCQY